MTSGIFLTVLLYGLIALLCGMVGVLFGCLFEWRKVPGGIWVGMWVGVLTFVVLAGSGWIQRQINETNERNVRIELRHKLFHQRCKTAGGRIIDLHAKYSDLEEACISRDGRWLGER